MPDWECRNCDDGILETGQICPDCGSKPMKNAAATKPDSECGNCLVMRVSLKPAKDIPTVVANQCPDCGRKPMQNAAAKMPASECGNCDDGILETGQICPDCGSKPMPK